MPNNQKSTQHLLSRYDVNEDETVSADTKGPSLLHGDFVLEGTSLSVAENAEVVAAIAPSAKKGRPLQPSLCDLSGDYVLVGAESPSKDVHGSPASIRSSLGSFIGLFVDLLEEKSLKSLNGGESERDYDERPLPRPFRKHSI